MTTATFRVYSYNSDEFKEISVDVSEIPEKMNDSQRCINLFMLVTKKISETFGRPQIDITSLAFTKNKEPITRSIEYEEVLKECEIMVSWRTTPLEWSTTQVKFWLRFHDLKDLEIEKVFDEYKITGKEFIEYDESQWIKLGLSLGQSLRIVRCAKGLREKF